MILIEDCIAGSLLWSGNRRLLREESYRESARDRAIIRIRERRRFTKIRKIIED